MTESVILRNYLHVGSERYIDVECDSKVSDMNDQVNGETEKRQNFIDNQRPVVNKLSLNVCTTLR